LIKVFYLIEDPFIEGILDELDSIDCEPEAFYRAAEMLESGELNTGFTYTDTDQHVTFIIICEAESADEFFNTFIHEVGHAAEHIASYYGIKSYSEELQYLTGEIALEMFHESKDLMCDECRLNFYNYGKVKIKIKGELN
jgi:hypothetical protein